MAISKTRPTGRPESSGREHITGIIQITRKGVGYVAWPDEQVKPQNGRPANRKDSLKEDIEIQTTDLHGALNGDIVEVELTGVHPRPKGKVAKVESRAKEQFVATLVQKPARPNDRHSGGDGAWQAIPADIKFYRPISIADTKGAAHNSRVLVKLLSFTGTEDPVGEIIEIIGQAGEHRVEMNAIVLEHGFSNEFPPEVLREAKEIEEHHAATIAQEAQKRTSPVDGLRPRADFRGTVTMTIDPVDAKDFDDALSIKELGDGTYEVGVHIADATFFVRPGTALDDEAVRRGTSVYLVDATIPMLPLELSGNVCSLRENEDRLAFSAVFIINKQGEVLDRRFTKSIIRSQKRFTYEEAQAVLDQSDKSQKPDGIFAQELLTLRSLSRLLHTKREKEGAIDFGDNEVKFVLDENGVPLGVVRKERIETNGLIEEFMLLANREVSMFVSKIAEKVPEKGYVFLYRIHDEPKQDRIEELATFVRAVGYDFDSKKKKFTARDIAHLLKQIEGKPEEHLIRTATLRSMAKAIYSTKNIGHFGLAFKYYTHFTSPIRRYPDMLAHRILASHLDGRPVTRAEFTKLERMCITATEQEAKAVSAERDSIRYKQVEYLSARVGQEFDAIISGVTEWGLYVEDTVSASEGLVRVRTIGDDFYNYSAKEYALVGQKTKKKYTLGDRVRVKLIATDMAARNVDFELVR